MTENYSALSRFRVSPSDDNQSLSLSIWDAETDTIQQLSYKNLDDSSLIKQLIKKINLETKNNNIIKGYKRWIDKGWYRSVDYYISSRAYYDKNPLSKLKVTDENIQHSIYKVKTYSPLSRKVSRPLDFFQALLNRRTKRKFEKKPLSQVIFYQGIQDSDLSTIGNVLSGFKIYCIIYNVNGIKPGVYSLVQEHNQLSCVQQGEFAGEMSKNLQGVQTPMTACFTIILVADFDALLPLMPYPKGLRCTYIESGRLMQRLLLAYGQYGLASLPTPALSDRAVSSLLKLDPRQAAPLYSLTVGYPVYTSSATPLAS